MNSVNKTESKAAEWIREYTKNNPNKVIFTVGDMIQAYIAGSEREKYIITKPRYDEVYFKGVEALDKLDGFK